MSVLQRHIAARMDLKTNSVPQGTVRYCPGQFSSARQLAGTDLCQRDETGLVVISVSVPLSRLCSTLDA